jgi:microcystin-dependent protein
VNPALFSLLGTQYGGNGTTTFALPNLQGRTPLHTGGGLPIGASGGEVNHTLSTGEMAGHTHPVRVDAAVGTISTPSQHVWAASPASPYGGSSDVAMSAQAIGNAGAGQSHPNLQPYLVINFVIALQGIYPSQG